MKNLEKQRLFDCRLFSCLLAFVFYCFLFACLLVCLIVCYNCFSYPKACIPVSTTNLHARKISFDNRPNLKKSGIQSFFSSVYRFEIAGSERLTQLDPVFVSVARNSAPFRVKLWDEKDCLMEIINLLSANLGPEMNTLNLFLSRKKNTPIKCERRPPLGPNQ